MVKNHVHKYKYTNLGSRERPRKVYACAFPDCTHFMPNIAQVKGKETICWECLGKTILTADQVRRRIVHPRCAKCRGLIKEEPKMDTAIELMLGALKG
jgi:hypothetical protein